MYIDFDQVSTSNVFIVGAGGIGCELLKDLVLTGFSNIHLIDLDTIEVSNLNRQFLFQKCHIGKSKAIVARESVLKYRPHLNIIAYHDSITNPKYDVKFFKQFNLVLSALDNISVRYHLNRMCLAANVALIESGTTGLLGQIKPIFKSETECYDCLPRILGKVNYASCTIRNTPSEPVHCLVWAKHLFNVLFGNESDEDIISPEIQIPSTQDNQENHNGTNELPKKGESSDSSQIQGKTSYSTQEWAKMYDYDAKALAMKLFKLDIEYLLGMGDLWKNRKPPKPLQPRELDFLCAPKDCATLKNSAETDVESEHRTVWDLEKCLKNFEESLSKLTATLKKRSDGLVWEKDDPTCMNFVAAASNVRCHVFGINLLSYFDCKSIAGNIIPAISTTNAIIAGLVVTQACYVLSGRKDMCQTLFLKTPNVSQFRNRLIGTEALRHPNPRCFSCSANPEVYLKIDPSTFLVKRLIQVLKNDLYMVQPDITIDDGKGTVLVSSEDDDTLENESKTLSYFGLGDGKRLVCDDYSQNYTVNVNIVSRDSRDVDGEEYTKDFQILGDIASIVSQPSTSKTLLEDDTQRYPSKTTIKRKQPIENSNDIHDTVNNNNKYTPTQEEGTGDDMPGPSKRFKNVEANKRSSTTADRNNFTPYGDRKMLRASLGEQREDIIEIACISLNHHSKSVNSTLKTALEIKNGQMSHQNGDTRFGETDEITIID